MHLRGYTHNLSRDICVQVNSNGVISFRGSFTSFSPSSLPNSRAVMIAPFWNDIDTDITGEIFYRFTTNVSLLNEAQLCISDPLFSPTLLFIATWNMVAEFLGSSDTVSVKWYLKRTLNLIYGTSSEKVFFFLL